MATTGNQGMEQLIRTVNRLQDAFAATGMPFGLDLPQIAVVGGQSAGKSSVLENFVGKDFLPRGAGIVTRRPLILQLHNSPEEYAEFLHCSGKRFTNFDEVRQEIEAETDRETGTNKGISSKPINLRVYSPVVLDLTLVDLPGLTRVPVGDQPADIDVQIRRLVLEYVTRENCLILAVSPANSDLANSDALRIAREVDPTGHRTIGVVTKLDLMDEGTDARDILCNKVVALKRGFIGVVNRSQKDIDGKKDIRAALEKEMLYFREHISYRDMADRLGTAYLQQTLNRELGRHIQETMTSIRSKLRNKMLEIKKELGQLEDISGAASLQANMMRLIQEFAEEVQTDIEGLTADIDTDRLGGGAKINRLFYNEFAECLSLDKIPANVLKREIAFAIKNIHGVRNGIFTPDMAFIATVVKVIQQYKDPVVHCVTLVGDVLRSIVADAAAEKMKGYDRLKEEVDYLVKEHIQQQEDITKRQLLTHVEAETSFMNTRHEDFIGVPGDKASPGNPEYTQSIQDVKRKLENTAKSLQKGWLSVHKNLLKGGNTECWFVLTSDALAWYKDDTEVENLYMLSLHGSNIKVRLDKKNKMKFSLFRSDGKPVVADNKVMELLGEDEVDAELWVAALKNAGVFVEGDESADTKDPKKRGRKDTLPVPDGIPEAKSDEAVSKRPNSQLIRRNRKTMREFTKSMMDPDMDRQIDVILVMVQSYLKIVSKTIRDLVPKYTMLLLVRHTQKYVNAELMSRVLTNPDTPADMLMEATGEDAIRRQELERAYTMAQEALTIISGQSVGP